MSRPWILISPASRGIGHHLARHLLRTTTLPILATARSNPDATRANLLADGNIDDAAAASDRLHVLPLDVTDESTIAAAAHHAAHHLFPANTTHHLHLAFALPGILHPEKSLRAVDADKALHTFAVNTLGPLLLMKHFAPFLPTTRHPPSSVSTQHGDKQQQLPAHAVWTTLSARVGSVSDNRSGGWYSYRSSKAAVNAVTKSFDWELRARSGNRAMAMAYHPGTVKTDLSREFWGSVPEGKLFDIDYAVERMVDVVMRRVGLEGRGRCWDWKGDEILP